MSLRGPHARFAPSSAGRHVVVLPAPSRPASIRDRMGRAGHRALVLAGKSRRGASSDAALRLGGGEAAVHAGPHRPTGQNATANSPRGTGDFR